MARGVGCGVGRISNKLFLYEGLTMGSDHTLIFFHIFDVSIMVDLRKQTWLDSKFGPL